MNMRKDSPTQVSAVNAPPRVDGRPTPPAVVQPKVGAAAPRPQTPPAPHVHRPPTQPGVVQPKPAAAVRTSPAPQAKRPPAAPPAYRPQPVPRVLQRKSAAPPAPPVAVPRHEVFRREISAPAPQPKAPAQQKASKPPAPAQPKAAGGRTAVQRKASAVVQAVKIYPNLHPGAVERVEPGNLFRLESFTDQYRLRKSESHGVYVPNQQYNFVRTVEGQTLLHNRYRHPSIAEGRQVLYAGEAYFNNGRLQWWSNGSGHYQPDADDAAQAGLPMDQFYTYQQVIKGEHKRRRA